MKAISAAVAAVLLLQGCATAHKIQSVQLGMNKAEVIKAIGRPASVSAQGRTEYLNYALSETSDQAWYGVTVPYFVRLVDGRVDAYGRMGDFDSTKTPTVRLETDEHRTLGASPDFYTEMSNLKALRDSGALTEEEFQTHKKKLLERY